MATRITVPGVCGRVMWTSTRVTAPRTAADSWSRWPRACGATRGSSCIDARCAATSVGTGRRDAMTPPRSAPCSDGRFPTPGCPVGDEYELRVPPGHHHSPIPSAVDVDRALAVAAAAGPSLPARPPWGGTAVPRGAVPHGRDLAADSAPARPVQTPKRSACLVAPLVIMRRTRPGEVRNERQAVRADAGATTSGSFFSTPAMMSSTRLSKS